ncbi:MAG: PAC2 family protein [Planctomycetia bacterium]|nr:PAC2 family protein [Planctomycetia bacterium]
MADTTRQNEAATLVAVWPGMGQVAMNAGWYLMSRLEMVETAPLQAEDLFDPDHVDVKDGLVVKAQAPQGRLFLWKNPKGTGDVAVFIGESQPQPGRSGAFCARLLDATARLGVKEVYTFASMATDMHPTSLSRVVGVATDEEGLARLRRCDVSLLETGRISGLNGVFLAAAAERGLRGIGLLGEIPAMAAQIPYPKASRTVLETFSALSGIDVDLQELVKHEKSVDRQLAGLVSKIEKAMERRAEESEEGTEAEDEGIGAEPTQGLPDEDRARIEVLFDQSRQDHAKTFELKRELDRLGVFKQYEDRFLDLFRRAG